MLIHPDNTAAFYKILPSAESFMNKIQVPSSFIKENKKMLTKNCLLKTDMAGMWWEAKIVREKSNYFICEGDWLQFVLHHQLKQGDVLLFFLVENSTFHVQPFTKKYCNNIVHERQVLYEELSSSSEEETTGPSKRARKMVPSDTEKRSVGMPSNYESKHEDDPHYNNPKRENASLDHNAVEIEYPVETDGSLVIPDHSAENLSHGPLAEKRKRKIQREEGHDIPIYIQTNVTVIMKEENDIAVNLQIDGNVIKKEEDDILVNLQTNATVIKKEESQEISEGGKELEQQHDIATDEEVGKANSGTAEDGPNYRNRHSLMNFDCDDPYFEIVITKSHTNFMTIPMIFAKKTELFDEENMRLVNEKGKAWEVEIEHTGYAVRIKRGWDEFRRQNKIDIGEACRFKLIQGDAANILEVHKIPTPHSLQHY